MNSGLGFVDRWFEAQRRAAAQRKGQFEIYTRADGDYGFRFRAKNHQITLTSGEGYTRDRDARRAIRNLQKCIGAPIVTLKPEAVARQAVAEQ